MIDAQNQRRRVVVVAAWMRCAAHQSNTVVKASRIQEERVPRAIEHAARGEQQFLRPFHERSRT